MDFSKLSSNEKLAAYGAVAGIVGAVLAAIGSWGGVLWLTLLLSIAMLAIVFMPQWSPKTTLPGSKGSLMLIVGGIAAVSSLLALLSLLSIMGLLGAYGGLAPIGLLVGIAGGLLMGWAAWQEFQAEGAKFQIGNAPSSTSPPPPAATPPMPSEPAPPAQATPSAPMAPPTPAAPPAEPMRNDEPMSSPPSAGPPPMGGTEDDRT